MTAHVLADGVALYDPARDQSYVLDPIAAFILACCDGAHDEAQIAAELGEAGAHVPRVLAELSAAGLLE